MLSRVALATALLCAAGSAHAGDKPLYGPAPAWVTPAPPIDPAKLGADGPVMLIADGQQLMKDGTVWGYADLAMRASSSQILTQIGTVKLPWMPDKGDLIIHRAEIIRGSEHIDLVKGGEPFQVLRREQGLEQLQLTGMLTATLPVEGLQIGDVLRVSFSITQADAALKGRMQSIFPLLTEPMPVGFGRVRLLWPAAAKVQWRAYTDTAKPVVKTVGDQRELVLTMPLPKPEDQPSDAPMRFREVPLLDVGDFADWADVSRTMAPLYATEGLIKPGDPLAAEVDRIKASETDPLKRAQRALELAQDKVRYLAIGMNGGNYVPQKPADTWQLKYGDCKAKTLLLLALLHAMDIEAEPVLASMQLGGMVSERLPMAGAFDHVLVRAAIGGRSLWLDGTGAGARLADIGDTPAFRTVLPLRPGGAELMPLPIHADARPDIAVAIDFDQSAGLDLPMLFKATVTMRGSMATTLSDAASQAGPEQKRDLIRNAVRNYLGDLQIGDGAIRYDAASATTVVTASGLVSTWWSRDQKRYRMDLDRLVDGLEFEPDRARPAWRDIPVATAGPSSLLYRTTVRLPGGGAGYSFEGDQTLSGSLAGSAVSRTSSLANGVVTVEDRLDNLGAEIAPADVAAVRARLALAKSRLLRLVAPAEVPPRWKQVLAAQKDGRFKPIEAMFAQAIAADPNEATGYESRASFRAGIYDYRGAIADLGKVIEIEPTIDVYLRRAGLYRAIGEDAKALADIETARALDPSSIAALNSLASLRTDGGDGAAALKLLQERIDQGGKERFQVIAAKAEVQADSGAAAEAIATLDAALAERPGDPVLLNERCWLKGTRNLALDTALKDCTKAIELADAPVAPLDSRAMVYFRMGRLEDALADLNAALDAAPTQAASLFMRGVVNKQLGHTAQAAEDLTGARLISPQIDRDYRKYGILN